MSAASPLYDLQASEQVRLIPTKVRALERKGQKPNPIDPKPELAFYRKYTEAMLRRYVRLSLSVGRMPALLGHDAFRGKMSTYRVTSFEDSVIFVYTQGEAAGLLRVSLRTIVRRYGEAIDSLTQIFLEYRLLEIDSMCGSSNLS
jgi:hypothetical protein